MKDNESAFDNHHGCLHILLRKGKNFSLNLGQLSILIRPLLLDEGAVFEVMPLFTTLKAYTGSFTTWRGSMSRLTKVVRCYNSLLLVGFLLILAIMSTFWRRHLSLLLPNLLTLFCCALNNLRPLDHFGIGPQLQCDNSVSNGRSKASLKPFHLKLFVDHYVWCESGQRYKPCLICLH